MTEDTLLGTAATVASWVKRLDEQGADALVQIREPSNRVPDFVRCAGQPGDRFTLQVDFHDGKEHLPIVSLTRAA